MSDQDLLEPRSRTLTSEMLKALVHSGSNWYTRFLPKILSEEIRAVPFAKRRQGCAYFRILYIFFLFFFLNTCPAEQAVLNVWFWRTHLLEKSQRSWESPHLPPVMCFQGSRFNLLYFPKRASWKQLSSISFVFAVCQSFLFKISLKLIFYFLSFIHTC